MYQNTQRFLKEYIPGKNIGYLWGILFLFITIITTTTVPIYIKDAINILSKSTGTEDKLLDELLKTSMIILLLGIALCIARVLSRVIIFLQGRKIEAEVRKDFFDAVVNMPLDSIAKCQSGDLVSRGINDVTSVRVMVSMGILHSINTVFMLIFCLYHMVVINPKLTLICLTPLPLVVFGTKILSKKMMAASRATQKQLGVLSETVREQFKAHTLLSIFPVFKLINEPFDKDNEKYCQKATQLLRIRVFLMVIVASILSLGMYILLRYGGPETIISEQSKEGGFDIGAFTAFSLFLGIMQGPLKAAGFLFPLLQRGEACLERIYEVRDAATLASKKDKTRKYQHQIPQQSSNELISISNLKYQYEHIGKKSFCLNIDKLTLLQGKKYGIFGKTGSGKTTLINAICGNIRTPGLSVKGIPYEDISSKVLSAIFSLVPQDSKHFSKTIKQNIDLIMANSTGDKNRLSFEDAYDISQLKTEVNGFKEGIDTLLGENGINLSGGQKQRLSILRALVKPRELLIMDDYVSAVDHKTEGKIIKSLFQKVSNQSVLLVSHRISALIPCDEIIIMDQGKIIDQGTHEQLYAGNNDYRETYDHQMLEVKLEELR